MQDRLVIHARKLRLARAAQEGRHIPVEEVALAVGVSRVRLTKLELGQFEQLSVQELTGLCRFFGVGIGELLEYVQDAEAGDQADVPGGQ